jgi:hypothetical protein
MSVQPEKKIMIKSHVLHVSDKACPRCDREMMRMEHTPDWLPREGRYWYRFWDRCFSCGHIRHYEEAKVIPPAEEVVRRFSVPLSEPGPGMREYHVHRLVPGLKLVSTRE